MAIIVDGQTYNDPSEAPDMKSIACVSVQGAVREYRCLNADVSSLPKYANLGTGSSCIVQDTGDYYEYNAKTKSWYKM